MSAVTMRRGVIEGLLAELDAIEDAVSHWQRDESAPAPQVREQHSRYLAWYNKAQALLAEAELTRFRDMYNGGMVKLRIKSFFTNPLQINPLFNSEATHSAFSKWQNDFSSTFKPSADTQREILLKALESTASISQELDVLAAAFQRIPRYLSVLHDADGAVLPKPEIANERDLQQVVAAVLSVLYDDVRAEDYIRQHGGRRTRADFFIGDTGILVETKMTRDTLRDKEVGDELLEDFGRYPQHPGCKAIFALVYDPRRWLRNPAGLQNDLTRDADLLTRTMVVH